MATTTDPASTRFSEPDDAANVWQRIVKFLVRRRIAISAIVFVLLIAEDVWEGVKPHDLANFHDPKSLIGLGLVLAGLALRSWAAGTLHKQKQLTMVGPYYLVRHPLYVGSFLLMVGFCTLIDDVENIWFVLGPILMLYVIHVLMEERKLAAKFGPLWTSYARSVPRFLPRRLPKNAFVDWSMSQWTRNREYQAFGTTCLALLALQLWRMY